MMSMSFVIAGFGGQGVLFVGKVIAYAGMLDGHEVSWLPAYGPEMRGGTANCGVCVSDAPIGSPLVTAPDILVAMNTPSYNKFIKTVAPGGKAFLDSSLVDCANAPLGISLYPIPATRLAEEENLQGIANMILLGKVLAETKFTSMETLEGALKKCIPADKARLLAPNLRAIELGMATPHAT